MSLSGAIDYPHATATDLFENFVISQEPGFVWSVHFGEHVLKKRLRYAVTGFQSVAQKAAHANSGVQSYGRSTLLAVCVLLSSALKPNRAGIRICHWITRFLLRVTHTGTGSRRPHRQGLRPFARLHRAADCGNAGACCAAVFSRPLPPFPVPLIIPHMTLRRVRL